MIDQVTHTIMAALPGWYIAVFIRGMRGDDGWEDHLSLHPIIAWEIERQQDDGWDRADSDDRNRYVWHNATPITIDGNKNHHVRNWAIKTPDGKFVVPGDTTLDNEAEAIEYLRELDDDEQRQRVKAVAVAP
jgi:hypothetical protein